ncbi:MAG: TatD family hydrolase [bacterium]
MEVIDTHSHFNLHQFEHDQSDAIARMVEGRVGTFCVGVDLETSDIAMRLAQNYESIWSIVGQHPTEWEKEFSVIDFKKLATSPRVVAIGECGLDYFREHDRTGIEKQKELFIAHIRLAQEYDLPLMLHIRPSPGTMNAYEDALKILSTYKKEYPNLRGTAHFFIGNTDIAQQFLDLGFYISFSGVITIFPEYENVVRFVPIDRILPETDAPFAAPIPYRGKRNEPAYVIEVVQKIAELKNLSIVETKAILLQNTKTLFNI